MDSASPAIERARLNAYRSMHLANRGNNREATIKAERAKNRFRTHGALSGVRHNLWGGREFTTERELAGGTSGASLIRGEGTSTRSNAIKPAYVKAKTLLDGCRRSGIAAGTQALRCRCRGTQGLGGGDRRAQCGNRGGVGRGGVGLPGFRDMFRF